MSTPKGTLDKNNTPFDPEIHQAIKGTARTTNDGRWIRKGRRSAVNGKGAKQLAARRGNPPAKKPPASAPEIRPEPTTAPGELPPLQKPATEADILGEFATPTIKPGEPEPAEPGDNPGDAPAPTLSEVAPDAPPPPAPGELTQEGLAVVLVGIGETTARVTIDNEEWELDPAERADLAATMRRILDKHQISPDISPEGELMLKVGMVTMRRMTLPKTGEWFRKLGAWFMGFFVRPKGEQSHPSFEPGHNAQNPPAGDADKPRNGAE